MKLDKEKLADVLAKAKAATPGDRCAGYIYSVLRHGYKNPSHVECSEDSDCDQLHHVNHHDAEHIASADPETVIALVEEIVRLRYEHQLSLESKCGFQRKAHFSGKRADELASELEDLRAKAEAATSGPWIHTNFDGHNVSNSSASLLVNGGPEQDCRFIAAFDPVTAIALLDELAAKDAEIAAWKRAAWAYRDALRSPSSQTIFDEEIDAADEFYAMAEALRGEACTSP